MIELDAEEKLKRIHSLMEHTKEEINTQWIICLSKLIFNAAIVVSIMAIQLFRDSMVPIRGIDNGNPTTSDIRLRDYDTTQFTRIDTTRLA